MTISDIADRAGVSIGAVSFALNGRPGVSEETRARVLEVADEMGWAPSNAARALAEASSDTVGLVLARDPNTLGVESFYMQFLAGLESELSPRGYGLLLQMVPTKDAQLATIQKWSRSRAVNGLLVVDVEIDDPRIEMLSRPGSPKAVVVGDPSVAGPLASVWTDDATSMREAVDHLVGLGHRRIARISGVASLAHTRIRDDSYRHAMAALGLEAVVVGTDYTPASGAEATRQVLTGANVPTALVYDNDVMAVAGLSVAIELGLRVPDDVSIVAWDDSVLCEHTYPRLTVLSHDVIAFGAHAGRRLLEVIDGAKPAAHLDSTPRVVQRESTGPAPA